jgi:hypothetical protein
MPTKNTSSMTTPIIETVTGRTVQIGGDLSDAIRACVARNATLRQAGIGGEWEVGIECHLHPSEYEAFLSALPARDVPALEEGEEPIEYNTVRSAKLSNGEVVEVGTCDPYKHHWRRTDGTGSTLSVGGASFPRIEEFV